MRPPQESTLPLNAETAYDVALNYKLKDLFRNICQRLNALSDGRISAIDNAASTIPTVGMYAVGDIVRNNTPVELGTAGSKYVITAWVCTVAGSPGTFVQLRSLTGN